MEEIKIVVPKSESLMKVVRKKCLKDCCLGDKDSVTFCPITRCPLFPYRFGQSPESYINEHPDTIIINEKGERV